MIIAFTGTRKGMTAEQSATVGMLLSIDLAPIAMVVHGDCIGADADFHDLAQHIGLRIQIHPCDMEAQRAYCKGAEEVLQPDVPLSRNRAMVRAADVFVAAPGDFKKHFDRTPRGSGTWMTINYARKQGVLTYIVWPDGSKVDVESFGCQRDLEDRER